MCYTWLNSTWKKKTFPIPCSNNEEKIESRINILADVTDWLFIMLSKNIQNPII